MTILDRSQLLVLCFANRGVEKLFQPVGDAGDRGVHEQYAYARGSARGHDLGDVQPVGK